ncbi:hypothetical protein NVIRPANT_00108 [Pantoea sp. Nvir]|nr:hypothetical protein NVIRPANT_00108 [Pantoea sp. Nvir]
MICNIQNEMENVENQNQNRSTLWKRILWLVLIYGASVLALGVVASLLRIMMTAAGMKIH